MITDASGTVGSKLHCSAFGEIRYQLEQYYLH
jgi:hypothetical protein